MRGWAEGTTGRTEGERAASEEKTLRGDGVGRRELEIDSGPGGHNEEHDGELGCARGGRVRRQPVQCVEAVEEAEEGRGLDCEAQYRRVLASVRAARAGGPTSK